MRRSLTPVFLVGLACSSVTPQAGGSETGDEIQIAPDLCAGWSIACALEADGSVHCWGEAEVDDAGPFKAIGCGATQVCALRLDGSAQCWQGVAWAYDEFDPQPPGTFIEISPGFQTACGLHPDGSVSCWGSEDGAHPPAPPGPFTTMANAWWGACGLRPNGTLQCWGDGTQGAEDNFGFVGQYDALSVGGDVCVRDFEGWLFCSGNPAPTDTFIDFDSGGHSCGVRSNHRLVCWGDELDEPENLDVPTGLYAQVAVGSEFRCARTVDGEVHCWGKDYSGPMSLP